MALLTAALLALLAGGEASRAAPQPPLVAFAGVRWSDSLQTATGSIYVVRADGSGLRRVTGRGRWTDTSPEWSRDGRRIAFGRLGSRGWRIYVVHADGRGLRALTGTRPLAEAPTWSPNGRAIAFAGMPARPPSTFAQQIYVVSVASGRVRQLTSYSSFRAGAGTPAWSPDGRTIVFVAWRSLNDNPVSDLWAIGADGTGARRLVRNASDPAWSPDGRIAFVRDGDIWSAAASGRSQRRLTHSARTGERAPSWSADGSGIAYACVRRERDQAKDTMRVYVMPAAGGRARAITRADPLFWADDPAWSPAG